MFYSQTYVGSRVVHHPSIEASPREYETRRGVPPEHQQLRPQSTEAGSHFSRDRSYKSQMEFCLQVAVITVCGSFSPLVCSPLKWSHFSSPLILFYSKGKWWSKHRDWGLTVPSSSFNSSPMNKRSRSLVSLLCSVLLLEATRKMVTLERFANERSMEKMRSEFSAGFCWGFCKGAVRLVHKAEEILKYGAQL